MAMSKTSGFDFISGAAKSIEKTTSEQKPKVVEQSAPKPARCAPKAKRKTNDASRKVRNIILSDETYRKLKIYAAGNGMTISDTVETIIEEAIKE